MNLFLMGVNCSVNLLLLNCCCDMFKTFFFFCLSVFLPIYSLSNYNFLSVRLFLRLFVLLFLICQLLRSYGSPCYLFSLRQISSKYTCDINQIWLILQLRNLQEKQENNELYISIIFSFLFYF